MDVTQLMMNSFPKIDSGDIADAGHEEVKIMDYAIRPLHHRMRLAGPVYTINQAGNTNFPTLQAIEKAPPGSVLVINAQASMSTGHFGSLMAYACQMRGIVGIVIDGAVRDVPDMIRMNFPVFSRGSMPRGNAILQGVLDQTIECGGIQINTDDMIFADATGVVVFPQKKAVEIYQKALSIASNEMGLFQQMSQGKSLLEIPEFAELHMPKDSA